MSNDLNRTREKMLFTNLGIIVVKESLIDEIKQPPKSKSYMILPSSINHSLQQQKINIITIDILVHVKSIHMNWVDFMMHGFIGSYDHTMSFHYFSQSFLHKHELNKNNWKKKHGIAK
jgi:hypothetical protein